ncbi:MAG TPA: hypothetical protein VHZ09_10175 [Acidobacteriaceae bacterium]|jgi:hypothetical protein|nr:hypothetical protein [Acidobacteriaceae bacterium]
MYGLATVAFGILDLIWGQFERSHQPIQSLVGHSPGQQFLAYIAAVWMIAAGLAILWRRSARVGAAASGIIYTIFAACWLLRFFNAIHASGWRVNIVFGLMFSLSEAVFLIAPAGILYVSSATDNLLSEEQAAAFARWMLGLPPIFFGLAHLLGMRFFATLVPHWLPFGVAWAGLTGIAFLLAGIAICLGRLDVLAARLLALMLLAFEFLVEIPPIFARLHSEETWGAAVYNLAAIGALWIFAEFVISRRQADSRNAARAEHPNLAHPAESLATGS